MVDGDEAFDTGSSPLVAKSELDRKPQRSFKRIALCDTQGSL